MHGAASAQTCQACPMHGWSSAAAGMHRCLPMWFAGIRSWVHASLQTTPGTSAPTPQLTRSSTTATCLSAILAASLGRFSTFATHAAGSRCRSTLPQPQGLVSLMQRHQRVCGCTPRGTIRPSQTCGPGAGVFLWRANQSRRALSIAWQASCRHTARLLVCRQGLTTTCHSCCKLRWLIASWSAPPESLGLLHSRTSCGDIVMPRRCSRRSPFSSTT
mmetsp:Transcript_140310/g.448455  ORF Transcript_140310/g.448455 Transcript_140310/m.448455 type:complete len:217 (-) Transcript_140310:274-924(-)